MIGSPLVVTSQTYDELNALQKLAADNPIDMKALTEKLKTQQGKEQHRSNMTKHTVVIPGLYPWFVTFSIELNHPGGTARHMSMSLKRDGRVPNEHAVALIAKALGFTGQVSDWVTWAEKLQDGGVAINAVQLINDKVTS